MSEFLAAFLNMPTWLLFAEGVTVVLLAVFIVLSKLFSIAEKNLKDHEGS